MNKIKLITILAVTGLSAPLVANADDAPEMYSYAWHDSRLSSDYGISTVLGGGITGFTDKTMRDAVSSSVGGLWDLRVTLGSHIPLALDVGYLGTAAKINALIGSQRGTLVGTTVEGALRYNVLPHNDWTPYAFVGMGWQRYDITGATFSLSDTGINSSDNSIVFPMGAGVAYRHPSGLVVDARGTFRANTRAGMVLETAISQIGNFAPMHSWEASAAIGYEF